jgi:hypothetical protein
MGTIDYRRVSVIAIVSAGILGAVAWYYWPLNHRWMQRRTSEFASPPQTASEGGPAVFVTSKDMFFRTSDGGMIERQLVEEAFLIAARDGMGLQTREDALREGPTNQPPKTPLSLDFSLDKAVISRPKGSRLVLWEKPHMREWCHQTEQTLEDMEKDSRFAFIDGLRRDGFQGAPDRQTPNAPPPDGAEDLVGRLDELSQFAAARAVHAAIHNDGESPQRLGVLVRAYANLGRITRHHWAIDYAVYVARSLLYAQRMVAADPSSPFALWHRAYAYAMAGYYAPALADLSKAKSLNADLSTAPKWVSLLEPLCRYQTDQLKSAAGAATPEERLAAAMAFWTVKSSVGVAQKFDLLGDAITDNPNCFDLQEEACEITGPGPLNDLVESVPQAFGAYLGANLQLQPGLPRSVSDQINSLRRGEANPTGRELVCQSLIKEGDPASDKGEPSWAALGRTVQEDTFVQVRRKADLIAYMWGIDASDYVAQTRDLVADHPFKGVLDAYGHFHDADYGAFHQAVASLPVERLTLAAIDLVRTTDWTGVSSMSTDEEMTMIDNSDSNAIDLDTLISMWEGRNSNEMMQDVLGRLSRVAPDSPWITARSIVDRWNPVAAADFEAKQGNSATVALELGKKITPA